MSPFNLQDYEPVEDRLRAFWTDYPEGRIETDMVKGEAGEYIVKASVWRDHVAEERPSATGYAQEQISERGVNATSALENCETSAIGRALANLGYAAKGKRPSREEMSKASSLGAPPRAHPVSAPGGESSAPQAAAAGTVEHGADGGDGVDTTSSVPPEPSGGAERVTGKGSSAPTGCKHLNGVTIDNRCQDCGAEMKVA